MKPVFIIVVIAILAIGGWMMFSQKEAQPSQSLPTEQSMESDENAKVQSEKTVTENTATEPIQIEGGAFYFKPNEIKVKKGEKVTITFTNAGGFHDFVIDEFNVKTKQLPEGESETIEFTPDQAGEFEFYCSVGDHRQKGMVGTLIVEE